MLPAAVLPPPSRRGKGSPGPRIRAAVAQLTRRNQGAEHLGARTGANPQAGMGEGETPASLVPHTVVSLLIHSQNRSRKGGREKRLEEERMEEEREEGSVGRGLQDPSPGSLEMPQPSARLPALDTVPTRPGEPVGVCGAPLEPGAPASSAQPPRGPPLQSSRRGPGSPCRRSPALGCSAGPRRLHAPPPAPRRRRTSLPGAPPPPRARLTSAGPAEPPLSTERVLAGRGALHRPWGQQSWVEWEGSPEGREGAPPSRLGRRELHAAALGRTPDSAWTRLLRFAETRSLCALGN